MATLCCPYGKYDILKLARSVICEGAVHAVDGPEELEVGTAEFDVVMVWVTVAGGAETVTVMGGGVLVAITVTTFVTGWGDGGIVGRTCGGGGAIGTELLDGSGVEIC